MITVRKANITDAVLIATYLLMAMEDIVYKLISTKDGEKAKAFMLYFVERENNQYSYQNCWVGEDENKIVAAANVYNGALLQLLREPVLAYIKKEFNRAILPEDETGKGEYYIDTISVDPHRRGKGIGTQMLHFLIKEYVIRQQQTLGLLVDPKNKTAKKLYLKMGFKPVGTKQLLGSTLEHLQIKGRDRH